MQCDEGPYEDIQAIARQREAADEAMAEQRRATSMVDIQEQLEETSQAMALRRERKKAKTGYRPGPLSLGACRFSCDDEQEMNRLVASAAFSLPNTEALRKIAAKAPPEPTAAMKKTPGRYGLDPPKQDAAKPQWLRIMCLHREVFTDSALVLWQGAEKRYYKLLYPTSLLSARCISSRSTGAPAM